jgi:uncharacterized protein (DUF2236 family)
VATKVQRRAGENRERVERVERQVGSPLRPGGSPVPAGPNDWGLFGPRSLTWKLHASPVLLVGGLRALICQSLHPLPMAGVAQHSRYLDQPLSRLRRTSEYVATIVYGDTDSAERAAMGIRRVHEKVRGVDPITGRHYYANDPQLLLWVHCVEVHSFLASYRAYGGKMTGAEQDAYLTEQVRAAELAGIESEAVPGTRAEYREYFKSMRPELCCSEFSRDAIELCVKPPMIRELLPYQVPLRVMGAAAVAITPQHLRRMAGIERSAPTYVMAGAAARAAGIVMRAPTFQKAAAGAIGKRTVGLPAAALSAAAEWERAASGKAGSASLDSNGGSGPTEFLSRP